MSEVDETHRIAVENANFLDSLNEAFGLMGAMLPTEQRESFEAALEELQPSFEAATAQLRSGELDERLAEVKPPALWELEKRGYNAAAARAGLPQIDDAE